MALGMPLHGIADVAHVGAGPGLCEPQPKRLFGHPEQLGRGIADRADGHGDGRVAVHAVDDGTEIEPEDVAFLETPAIGDPVDDLFVLGGTDRVLVAVNALEGRPGTLLEDEDL